MAIKPMLCRNGDESSVTNNPHKIWERKYDGARLLSSVTSAYTHLASRSGKDKSRLFPELRIRTKVPAILDGEVVVYNSAGRSVFKGIQQRINVSPANVKAHAEKAPATYEVFDVLEAQGPRGTTQNLRGLPLSERKELLADLLIPNESVHLSEYSIDGPAMLAEAYAQDLEGIIGKDLNSPYQEGMRRWTKVKLWVDGIFLAVGFTEGTGWRKSTFGALVLADLECNHVGSVGTGFTSTAKGTQTKDFKLVPEADMERSLQAVMAQFKEGTCLWKTPPEKATWVAPFLVKVRYLEKTDDGQLRFPAFKGFVE